jgi:hypothetical protein
VRGWARLATGARDGTVPRAVAASLLLWAVALAACVLG